MICTQSTILNSTSYNSTEHKENLCRKKSVSMKTSNDNVKILIDDNYKNLLKIKLVAWTKEVVRKYANCSKKYTLSLMSINA